jgi:hypothetical protein
MFLRILSLHRSVTGNFNSLFSRKNSLFFLKFHGRPQRAKHSGLCSMVCVAVCKRGPKSQDFPVKFPVSRELGPRERFARDSAHRHIVFRIRNLQRTRELIAYFPPNFVILPPKRHQRASRNVRSQCHELTAETRPIIAACSFQAIGILPCNAPDAQYERFDDLAYDLITRS